jgi:hypothetical protein
VTSASPGAQGGVDFSIWLEYFKLALEGCSTSLDTPQAIVRRADEVAKLAATKQRERRGQTGEGP